MTDQVGGEVSERLVQPTTTRIFSFVMGSCLIYAGIRYHVAEGVPLAQAPLYILNKAISLGGLAFLAMSYLVGKVRCLVGARERYGMCDRSDRIPCIVACPYPDVERNPCCLGDRAAGLAVRSSSSLDLTWKKHLELRKSLCTCRPGRHRRNQQAQAYSNGRMEE